MDRIEVDTTPRGSPLSLTRFLSLLAATVAQMLERDDFRTDTCGHADLAARFSIRWLRPRLVAIAQTSSSAGTTTFQSSHGTHYQREDGQREQICMTVPLLEGLDGIEKMSKSKGNYVGLTEAPEQQFGKPMRITDEMIPRYARLAAFHSVAEAGRLSQGLSDGTLHPMTEKKRLAEEVVTRYHGAQAASLAREYFERTVQRRELPGEVPEMAVGEARRVIDVIVAAGFAESKRAAED